MSEVLIPFGNEYLALTLEQINEARKRAHALMPQAAETVPAPAADQILDAEGMEKATGIPATWFLEQARRGSVPHLRAGKYVRFELAKVLEALRAEDGTRTRDPLRNGRQTQRQSVAKHRYQTATTSRGAPSGSRLSVIP